MTSASGHADEPTAGIETLLDALVDVRRRIATAQAEELALLAAACGLALSAGEGDPGGADLPMRSLAAQIGAALRISDRTVQRLLSDATVISAGFPATLAALGCGEISRAHVQVIVDAGLSIDDAAVRAEYEESALAVARRETPGRSRPVVRLLAERLHPIAQEQRHAHAARTRSVWVRDLDDGMAELIATLPATIAHGVHDRLNRMAKTIVGAHAHTAAAPGLIDEPVPADARSLGEVRADVFADLLLTGHASPAVSGASIPEGEAIIAQVQVTVPVLTALGADTAPAELAGRAPIDTATALRLAATAPGWDRVLTHPVTGSVLAVDRYRPSDQLRRVLRVRDEHCRFRGCRIPAIRCDIDHTTARQHEGPTEVANLAHLCRRHHTLKHHSAWRVRQDPGGVLHWTSPTGRSYPDHPARTLAFTANA